MHPCLLFMIHTDLASFLGKYKYSLTESFLLTLFIFLEFLVEV